MSGLEEVPATDAGGELELDRGAAAEESAAAAAAAEETTASAVTTEEDSSQPETIVADASSSSIATPPATPSPAKSAGSSSKIDVLLKPAGNAPILKKKKWTVDRHKQIGWICDFIRKLIRTETEDSVFVYVNQSFSPSPDTEMGTLFDCFGSDGKLVIYYCRTQAWG